MGNTQTELLKRYEQWLRIRRRNSEGTIYQMMMMSTKKFLEWLPVDIEEVNQEIVDEYLSHCHQIYAPNTLTVVTANLRKLLIHFLGKGFEIRIAGSTAPNRDKVPFSKQEIKRMFLATEHSPLESAIIKTLYYTGIRVGELMKLNIGDIDFERYKITIKHGKNDVARTINITQDCALSLKRWLINRPQPKPGHEDALFLSPQRFRINYTNIHDMVKDVAIRADIKKPVYPHKFRITNITHMAEAGLTIREIQAQSGHSDLETLYGYIQHSSERIRNAYLSAFDDVSEQGEPVRETVDQKTKEYNTEYIQQTAFRKYLDGEISRSTLDQILSSTEDSKPARKETDLAYL